MQTVFFCWEILKCILIKNTIEKGAVLCETCNLTKWFVKKNYVCELHLLSWFVFFLLGLSWFIRFICVLVIVCFLGGCGSAVRSVVLQWKSRLNSMTIQSHVEVSLDKTSRTFVPSVDECDLNHGSVSIEWFIQISSIERCSRGWVKEGIVVWST